MGNMTHYVDHAKILIGIDKIRGYMTTNDLDTSSILAEFEALKDSIRINGKTISNKEEDFAKAAKKFKENNNSSIGVLDHTINMYFDSKNHSVTIIRSEKDKIV